MDSKDFPPLTIDGSGNASIGTLTTTDWNEEWKALQAARHRPDDAHIWDERAKHFGSPGGHSNYRDDFLALAAIKPGERVLDMGCGNGALALPLADAGCDVVAADFSRGMLDELRHQATEKERVHLDIVQMSWDDDWSHHGVDPGSVDVALASRSIVTDDLRAALVKLSTTARRRCCITLPTAASPRVDAALCAELGIAPPESALYLYAVMILAELGRYPELSYIVSSRDDRFTDADEAEATLGRMLRDGLGPAGAALWPEASRRLHAWLADNLIPADDAPDENGRSDRSDRPSHALRLRRPRQIRWAFIAWNVA